MKKKLLFFLAIMMSLQGLAQSITINFPDIDLTREGMNEMVVTLKNDNPNIISFNIEMYIPNSIYLVDIQFGTKIKEHNPNLCVSFGKIYKNGKELTSITSVNLDNAKSLPQGEYELMRLTFLALSDASLGNNIIDVNRIDFASSSTISLPSKSFNINVVNDFLFDITNDISMDISNTNITYKGLGEMSVQMTNNKNNLTKFLIGFVVPDRIYVVDWEIGSTLKANNPNLDLDFLEFDIKDNKKVILVKGNQKDSKPFPQGQYNLMKFTFTADNGAIIGNYTFNTFIIHYDCGGITLGLPQTYNMKVSSGSTNNYLSIDFSDVNVPQGGTGEMVVKVNNNFNLLKGVQIEFILPNGIKLVDAQLGEKVKKINRVMTLQYNSRRESDWHTVILGFQISLQPMPNGEYELMRLTFEAEPDMPLGKYAVSTCKIEFASDEKILLPTHTFNINVVDGIPDEPIMGDVNNDGNLSLSDAICIISWLLEQEPPVFVEELADFNGDGHISNSDAVAIIMHLLNGEDANMAPAKNNTGNKVMGYDSRHDGFDIQLGALSDITAMMMDVTLPDGITLNSASLDGIHSVAVSQIGHNTFRMAVYSFDMATIGKGAVLHCKTSGGQPENVDISNFRLVDTQTTEWGASDINCSPTGIIDVTTGATTPGMNNNNRCYDLSGRAVNNSTHGIIIRQGKKYANTMR